jgi:Polyketide cyclase / dehydrase and lipid transport
MARIESTILVPISVEDTFSFLNTRESHLKFIPRITAFDQTSPGTFGEVGTTVAGMLNYFGIRIPVEYEMIEVEPNRRLAMKGQMGSVAFTDGYLISKHGAGTEIKFWLELKPTGWTKILNPFAGLIGKLHAWETLRNLKRAIQIWEVGETSQV